MTRDGPSRVSGQGCPSYQIQGEVSRGRKVAIESGDEIVVKKIDKKILDKKARICDNVIIVSEKRSKTCIMQAKVRVFCFVV